jgi:putative endonuclease
MSTSQKQAGAHGETLAAQYLQQRDYHIAAQNWHCQYGEIDIIAQKDDLLAFVEVRTRRAPTTESAFASITPTKRQKLIAAAQTYLAEHDPTESLTWRIDVIAVALWNNQPPQIEHIEDALDW